MLSNLGPASVASFVDCEAVEVVAPAHPKNRFLMAYWRDRIQPDGAALRRDILPADLKHILGGIFIVEPVDEGADMIHRLVGTENERRLGMRCTGRRFTECYCPRMAAEQITFNNEVLRKLMPGFLRGRIIGLDMEHAQFEASYLPVRTEGGLLQVLGGMYDLAEPA